MSRQYDRDEEDAKIVTCEICDCDIMIDFYADIGDTVACDDCGAYYILQSLAPPRISLLEGEEDDDSCTDLNFDD